MVEENQGSHSVMSQMFFLFIVTILFMENANGCYSEPFKSIKMYNLKIHLYFKVHF